MSSVSMNSDYLGMPITELKTFGNLSSPSADEFLVNEGPSLTRPGQAAASLTTPSKSNLKEMSQSELSMDQGMPPPAAAPQYALLQQPACSPSLHTPVGANSRRSALSGSSGTPHKFLTPSSGSLKGQKSVPRFYTTPGGTSKPILANPFDAHVIDRIHSDSPMFSPNMFKVTEPGSAEKTPKSFRWSIDQIAILKPADIEEMPVQQDTLNILPFPELESKVQKAIDRYFDKGNIAPSPWTENVKKFVLPRTPGSETIQHFDGRKSEEIEVSTKDVCCQTKITLPVDFDLEQVLGNNFQYVSSDSNSAPQGTDCDNQADISTSSLRRKLFFHGDEGTPLSPVRSNKSRMAEVMDMTSPAVSPLKFGTPPCQGKLSPIRTPSTGQFSVRQGQFSSSPISGPDGPVTPYLRRCSTAPGLMASPEFSPINNGAIKDFTDSLSGTPMCLPLQATPSSGRQSNALASPGMSPITIRDGGYMASPEIDKISSKSDSLRRRVMRGQIDKLPIPRELQMSACDSPVKFEHEIVNKPPSSENSPDLISYDDNARDMDMSYDNLDNQSEVSSHKQGSACETRPEFTEFREMYEFDSENTLGFQAHSTGLNSQDTGYQTQDTGYQTCQSIINQDTMGLTQDMGGGASTNITSHFSCLPSSFSGSHENDNMIDNELTCKKEWLQKTPKVENIGHGEIKNSGSSKQSVDNNVMAKRPSSLIFSELEMLANKVTSSSSLVNSNSVQSQEGSSYPMKKLCKSYSANDLRGSRKSLMSAIEQLTPNDADRVVITEHSRKYTQGSMINHEQVYEPPPIYVMTSNSQEYHSSQSSGAKVKYISSQNDVLIQATSSVQDKRQWQNSCTPEEECYLIVHTTKTPSMRDCDKLNNNYNGKMQDNSEAPSYFRKPNLYHGRPAHFNPAFKIETLTPEEAPPFSSQGGPFEGYNNKSLAERLLSPSHHPASPCPGNPGLNETEIRIRARRALGHIHEESGNGLEKEIRNKDKPHICPWFQKGTQSQQKLQHLVHSMEKRKEDVSNMLPSDVAIQVLRKAEKDLIKLKNGEVLDPSFLDNTSFQDSCIIDDFPSEGEEAIGPNHC